MDTFANKVAVVTGAASGIGLCLVERFATEGMRVVLADVDPALPQLQRRLLAAGVDAVAGRTDVADPQQVDALANIAVDRFGAVHIVCNNAGTGGPPVQR
jgi:NAD(P)-dependent dehydrogenase (short-subunit alcohol dehydrogenase family)